MDHHSLIKKMPNRIAQKPSEGGIFFSIEVPFFSDDPRLCQGDKQTNKQNKAEKPVLGLNGLVSRHILVRGLVKRRQSERKKV